MINERDGDEMDEQRSCIFIDTAGILLENGFEKEMILRQDAIVQLTSLAEPEEMEIVLLLDENCSLGYWDVLPLFSNAPWSDKIYTILKGTSLKQKVAAIAQCIEKSHDWQSFVIFSEDYLEPYFPRRTVFVSEGILTEKHLQRAKKILERVEIQEKLLCPE